MTSTFPPPPITSAIRPLRPIWAGMETNVTSFLPSHGWTAGGTGGTAADDTSVFTLGAQSVKLTSNGSGGICRIEKGSLPAFDITKFSVGALVRIADTTKMAAGSSLQGKIGTSIGAGWSFTLWNSTQVTSPLVSGQWQWLTFDIANSSVIGTPPPTNNCTYIAFQIQDASGGAATLNINAIRLLPKPSTIFPNGAVSISLDDGFVEQDTIAGPILDKYGYAVTAYVICDLITANPSQYMSFAQLTKRQNYSGWEIQAHAARLADHNAVGGFTGLSAAQVELECQDMIRWGVTNGFGQPSHWASPQGYYNDTVMGVMGKYFASHRTIDSFPNGCEVLPVRHPLAIRCQPLDTRSTATFTGLIDQAYANADWLNLYTHKVVASGPTGTQITTANFQTVVDYLASKGIPVLPVGKVLQMLSAGRA